MLSVGRLDPLKRLDLLLEAAALEPRLTVVVAGEGPDRERLARLSSELGLGDRVRFDGRVGEERLAELYATCRAVYYAPVDEDFGMVPLEAFRACKPVVTATDSGGPLDFVVAGETGWVVEPEPGARSRQPAASCSGARRPRGATARPGSRRRLRSPGTLRSRACSADPLRPALQPVEDAERRAVQDREPVARPQVQGEQRSPPRSRPGRRSRRTT